MPPCDRHPSLTEHVLSQAHRILRARSPVVSMNVRELRAPLQGTRVIQSLWAQGDRLQRTCQKTLQFTEVGRDMTHIKRIASDHRRKHLDVTVQGADRSESLEKKSHVNDLMLKPADDRLGSPSSNTIQVLERQYHPLNTSP